MKIPSVPKGFVGFPLVIVLIAVGAIYLHKQRNNEWLWLWKITEIDTNEKQLNSQKRK